MARRWQPIVDGAARRRALDAVVRIADALAAVPITDASLEGGAAGLAVAFAYLGEALPGHGYDDLAAKCIDEAVASIARSSFDWTFFSGWSGVGWAAEHAFSAPESTIDDDDPNMEIDGALEELLSTPAWPEIYDLIGGLVGLGVYALERGPRGGVLLGRIVEHLRQAAEASPPGCTWLTKPGFIPEHSRAHYPDGYYDLGVAHGVPGVIALLAGICARSDCPPEAPALLLGAVDWLLVHGEAGDGGFGYTCVPGRGPAPSRTAWCYGDPGVAATLWTAGTVMEEERWRDAARAAACRAAARPLEEAGVVDASLCHGAAGLLHIFNRLHEDGRHLRVRALPGVLARLRRALGG